MKIDEDSTLASTSAYADMPPASAKLLKNIRNAKTTEEFIIEINKGREVHSVMGKTELCRWVEVLNRCDEILETATKKDTRGEMFCDHDVTSKRHSISVIRFTVLLFECTSSRRVYRSMDRVLALMESTDMEMLAEVLRLLQTMGKRSKYLTQRVQPADQATLVHNLTAIAQCWGGKLRSVKMAECVKKEPNLPALFPFTYTDSKQRSIVVEKLENGDSVAELVKKYMVQMTPTSTTEAVSSSYTREDRYCLLARLRMLNGFDQWTQRFKCLIVRLLSVSTLIYCRCQSEENPISSLLYSDFVDELVALLKTEKETGCHKEYAMLDSIHTEALSTLCSIANYEKEPKIPQILEALSAGSYHGYLSVLTRQVVDELKNNNLNKPGKPSVALSTALFSFIYHLASIEPGGDTLVASGLTQTLLSVIGYHDLPIELITFGTRCARIIDLFTTIDVAAFKAHNGMEICVNRIVHEIDECRKEQPFVIDTSYDMPFEDDPVVVAVPVAANQEGEASQQDAAMEDESMTGQGEVAAKVEQKTEEKDEIKGGPWIRSPHTGLTCHQQRSGLIKGLLTFVKRAIQDPQFHDSIRHIMEGGLPEALMHILSNAEYYSPSLFHQSAQLITNYVYQNPDELSVLQRRHVPYVLYQSMLRKELPNSRDVISTIGAVFTAMCLNERGLKQFKSYEPFDQIFRILLSVKFLVSLKKKRNEMHETAASIGGALDELLRHYPDLKPQMLRSMIRVLDRLIAFGKNPPAKVDIVMALAKHVARNVVLHTTGSASAISPTSTIHPVVQALALPLENVVETRDDEQPMEMDEEYENEEEESDVDEEAEMSMDEMSGEGIVATNEPTSKVSEDAVTSTLENKMKPNASVVGLDMVCDDGNGRKILPLGDYMLISAKIIETMMTQQSNLRMIDQFVDMNGIEKMLVLCQLHCLHNEIALTTYSQSVANIVKFIVFQRNSDSSPTLMKSVMAAFSKTILPIFVTPPNQFPSLNQAESSSSAATESNTLPTSLMIQIGEKIIHNTLTNLNNILPVLMIISKSISATQLPVEVRHRVFETWKTPEGVRLYGMLRKLSRMLVWESSLIRVLKPSIRTCATQTDPVELSDPRKSGGVSAKNPNPVDVDVDSVEKEPKEKAWVAAGISQEEHDFWTQHKPLADLVTKTGRTVSDMVNLVARSITAVSNSSRRTRRQEGGPSAAATQCANMIFTSIYKDLKWTPKGPINSPMAYARYTDLLMQLGNALFDERRVGGNAIVQQFYLSGCHNAFFELFTEKLSIGVTDGGPNPALEDLILEWCRLAGRLANRNQMQTNEGLPSRHHRDRIGNTSEFDINKYLKLVYRDLFNAFTGLFDRLSAIEKTDLQPYQAICENSFSVFKEVVRNLTNDSSDTNGGNASRNNRGDITGAVRPADNSAAWPQSQLRNVVMADEIERPADDLDESQVQMLMEMGFSRDIVIQAIRRTHSTDEAANFLLTRRAIIILPSEIPTMFELQRNGEGGQPAGEATAQQNIGTETREGSGAQDGHNLPQTLNDIMNALPEVGRRAVLNETDGNRQEQIDRARVYFSDPTVNISEATRVAVLRAFQTAEEHERPVDIVMRGIQEATQNQEKSVALEDDDDDIAAPLIPPLNQLKIENEFSLQSTCLQLIPLIKRMLNISTELVFTSYELVLSMLPAMSVGWKRSCLITEIIGSEIVEMCEQMKTFSNIDGTPKAAMETAKLLSSRVHFSCLLFDHLADDYIDIAKETGLVDVLLSVVGYCEQRFHTITDLQSLLSRLILWLDLYDKNNRTVTRRRYLETMTKTLVWHYQVEEVTEGVGPRRREKKWTAYEPSLQSVLTDAFFAGKKIFHGVLKRSGRTARKVRIDLTYMEQIDANNSTRDAIRCELPSNVEVDVEKFLESEKRLTWSPEENNRLLMLTVQLLQKGTVHHMCAHSLLNFAARLTRNPENAVKFMEAGGIEYVMRLRSAPLSSSAGLLSIIISNCIDDETMLAYVFDKTIRKVATTPQVQMMEYLHPGQSKSIDWFVTLNKLMPLSARSPGVFMDVFSKACKMNGSSITLSSAEKEKTKKASNIPIASGAASTASSSTASEAPVQTTNNATAPTAVTPTELTTEAPATKPEMGATTTTAAVETYASKTNARVLNIIKMLLNEVLYGDFPVDPLPGHGRIINRDQILLIVAEIVMSHPSTAILVAESQDKGKSIILTLLEDYIYPSTDKVNVTPSLKTLISVIASSPNAKAQELVVQDVKGALQTFCEKAAAKKSKKPDDSKAQDGGIIMDEDEKTVAHRISELCSVIMTMCKSCSTEPPTPENRHRDKASGNIVKVFHKKKLCNDLVRSITFLHLGVKESIDAINQILKTLELLMDSAGIQATPHPPNLPIGTTRANVQRRRYNIETTLEHRAITGQFLTGTMEVDDDYDDDEAVLMRELDEDPDEELWDRLGEEMRNQVRERAIRAVQDRRVDEVERNILRRYATEELFQQQPRRRAVQQPQQNQQNQHQMIVFQTDENHINDGIQEEIDDDDVGANQAAIDQAHDAAAHNEDDDGEDEEDEEDEDEEEDEEQMDSDNEVEVIQPDESRNDENPTDHYDEYLGVQEQDHHQRGDDDDEDEDEDEDDDDDEDDREEEDREVEVTMQEAEQPGARREIDEADSIEEENDDFDTLEDEVNRIDDLELFESATISNTRPSIGFAEFLRNEEVLAFERRVPSRTRAGNVLQHPLLTRHQSEENPNIRAFAYRGGELMPISFPRILHRQNAIRRNPEVLTSSTREGFSVSEMISRAIGGANIGDGPGRLSHRPADGGPGHLIERIIDFGAGFPHSSIGFSRSFLQAGGEESQQKITVLTSLERLSSYVSIMEPVSIRYVCVVVNSLLTRKERQREAREKEIEKQKETESSKKKKTEAGVVPKNDQTGSTSATPIVLDGDDDVVIAAPSATVTTNTVSETTAPNASRNVGEDTATTQAVVSGVSAAPPAETAAPPAEVAPAPPAQPPNTDEPMDVTVSVAQVRPSPLSFPVEISVEQIEEQRQRLAAEIMAADEQARVAQEERAQEFRAILGDIEIPVGVDPAFLAALPEDMRAEVIRDYRRQQRAERAARPVVPQVPPNQQQQQPENREEAPVTTGTAAPVVDVGSGGAQNEPGNGAGAGAVTVPLIEPINAEFLNALPPELQEEVLAEHERRVREAEEAMRRANAPAAVVEHEMDGAAVIASLPANERAQVLAEMDEAELAELPVAMQEEARRARAQNLDSQMLRYHRLLFRRTPRNGVPTANRANNGLHAVIAGNSTVGLGAGTATQAHPSAPQLLDRDAIVILCLLYLMESKVSFNRLQKVIRNVCVNSNTCDFVIWCLLALLDKASDTNVDDEEFNSNVPNWLETVTVSGVGHNERALRIGEKLSKVSIHSMISVPLCRNVLDLLATIAKSYPGNFLPIALRVGTKPTDVAKQWPTFDMFWGMVQSNTKVPLRKEWQVPPEMQLEECAVGQLLMYLGKPAVARTSQLQDRIMKVASTIFQTLPDYSLKALKIKNENYMPLTSHLALVIDTMTKGSCTTEGLNDGLTLLAEAMRTFDESTAEFIFDKLFSAVAQLGNSLLPQISRLILELDEAQTSDIMTISTFEKKAGTSEPKKSKTSQLIVDTSNGGRVAHGRFDGERLIIDGEQNMRLMMSSCKELQLPAVTVLTDKAGAQYSLLSALQTLVKVRGHLKVIRADKRKKAKEMEKKKQKEEEEQRKKEEEEIAAVVAEFQNRNARLQAQAQTSQEGAPESTTETAPAPISEATSEPVQEATAASNQEATTAPVADAITEPVPEAITESAPEATTATATAPGATAATAPETTTAPVPQQEDETTEQSKKEEEAEDEEPPEIRISERLESLNPLWDSLSECLQRLGRASDPHAVLALQPAAEAFFLVHASQHKKEKKKEGEAGATPGAVSASSSSHEVGLKEEMDPDTKKLIEFAEKHREVLNQALRQNGAVLSTGGPFAILTHFPKLLDFDVKRRYFRKELTKSEPAYRRNDVSVQVNRNRVFSDSFRELYRIRPSAWKNRFYIIFQGEEGQDAGGLLREWFSVITKEIFNPNYALFITAPGDMVTYMINKASYINPEHLDYFKFVGRLIAKSVFEHKYLDCYFTRAFYKHILNVPVKYQDLESEDPAFFKSLKFLLENPIDELGLDLTFSTEVEEFGVRSVRDLKANGRQIEVTDANKDEYVQLICQMKMTGSIRKQLDAFLQGFYEIIPKDLIAMFNEQELELLISGLPTVDIDDLSANTDYKGYQKNSVQIQWFWRALRSFEKEDKAKFLQFVTGTSKVPLQGFASLEGMNGTQKFSIHLDSRGGDRLPAAHTCFNQLDLPQYESYEKLRDSLLLAIRECTEGFGFA